MGQSSALIKFFPLAKIEPEYQQICRDLIYDNRRFDGDICVYDPLTKLTELFAGQTTKRPLYVMLIYPWRNA
ncbi:MAG UNVERIFIED_CONTAM: hypothetical protein LVR29_12465 [Microcystis novacekii LVE1205-3]|jgi:5-methyltetrahydrofolate--homocysteine methyltransferase